MNTPIGIIGFGIEGRSTLAWLQARGLTDITVFDRQEPELLPKDITYGGKGENYLAGLDQMATAFRSAGVRPDLPEIIRFKAGGGRLTSQIELVFEELGRQRILGVTGTVGKGTTCALLEAMLDRSGQPAVLGGNFGLPALDAIRDLPAGANLILELSSFQLATLNQGPSRAAVLRTTVEHLDWHPNRREYWECKANLVKFQTPADFLVWCSDADGSRWIAGQSPARKRSYGSDGGIILDQDRLHFVREGRYLGLEEIKLPGAFNLENVAAAAALALDCGCEFDAIAEAARGFAGLEHRLEKVGESRGIAFYNDSYATRPEATMGAVAALAPRPLGLILGGSDKGADFRFMGRFLHDQVHLKAVALIGDTAPRLLEDLQSSGVEADFRLCAGLEDSLEFLLEKVPAGGSIALSPACASFGLFANYKQRGKAFKDLVSRYIMPP